jgi:hypothetical protein
MSAGRTVVEIGGDNSGLKKSLAESGGLVSRFAKDMASVQSVAAQGLQKTGGGFAALAGTAVRGIGSVATVAGTVAAVAVSMANNTARAANEINKMSASSGIGAQDMAKLAYAFNVGGVASQELGQGLKGLAMKMNEAANGNADAQDAFKQLGVEIKDTSGRLRPVNDVLLDVAESFKRMPAGAQKSALAVKLMEEAGLRLIPVFDKGADAIRNLGKEAENFGVVFTPEQMAAAKEWEENLQRLKTAGAGLAHQVGNEIIPHMAHLSTILLENKGAGLGWFDSFMAMLTGADNPAERIADLTKNLELLRAKQAELAKNGSPADAGLDAKIAETEKALLYFADKAKEAANAVEKAESDSAGRRAKLEQELATKKGDLAKQFRYVQTGELALIETNTKASVDRQIADQQRLVDAVRAAWQQTRNDAGKAKTDAGALSAEASKVRTNATDKAQQMRDGGLSEEQRQSVNASRAEDMLGQGRYYAAAAGAAQLDGRAKDFEQYAKQAKEFLDRAEKFADASGNADLVEQAGKQQAGLLDTQAKAKQKEATDLDAQAANQAQTLNEVQAKLDALKESARSIEVSLKTKELKANIADIEAELATLTAPRQIPVSIVKTGGDGPLPADTPARAFGGPLPGRAPHDRADNQLYWGTPGEWVIQRPAVRHYGSAFIAALNSMKLPKYAMGGQIGFALPETSSPALRNLNIPTANFGRAPGGSSSGGTPVVLDFGSLGRHQTNASPDVAKQLIDIFRREGLKKGGRR